jgi:glycosyltransferase involved in cell wall biosynthesis
LESIEAGSVIPDQIIVADDGSEERYTKEIKKWQSSLPLIHIWHEDKGFRKCRILNKSINLATNDYCIFLDGDCIPHRHFIKDHCKLAEKNFFIQGRRCFVPQKEVPQILSKKTSLSKLFFLGKIKGYFKCLRLPKPIILINRNQRGLIGCNWSAWRQDLVKVNGFDEDYEGWGIGEDSDVCTRLYNLGISRKFVYGRAIVFHLNHDIAPKEHLHTSMKRLQQTIESQKIRCDNGLSKVE